MALGRVDNEGVRHALQGQRSKKGMLDLGIKSILCSQVRHHFVRTRARQSHAEVRVSTTDNVLADPLSRGDIAAFMAAAAPMKLELVRMRLTKAQRSTTHYAEAKQSSLRCVDPRLPVPAGHTVAALLHSPHFAKWCSRARSLCLPGRCLWMDAPQPLTTSDPLGIRAPQGAKGDAQESARALRPGHCLCHSSRKPPDEVAAWPASRTLYKPQIPL